MIHIPKNKKLVVFDGVCNLCNASVQFVIKHDKNDVFLFCALQSRVGQQIVKTYGIDLAKIDSLILYTPKKGMHYQSTAALKIAIQLDFPINLMGVFFIVPSVIRNWVYQFIAKNRYKWFGKNKSCMIPTPELKRKFLVSHLDK